MSGLLNTLKLISKKYKLPDLLYDDLSKTFVESVCSHFSKNSKLSNKQVNALVKISNRINEYGFKALPVATLEPEQSGFLGLNCKTGEVNWYSWQIFESK